MQPRLGGGHPEALQHIPGVRLLARRLVPMAATEMIHQHDERRVIKARQEGDGTSAGPARDDEPGSSHVLSA